MYFMGLSCSTYYAAYMTLTGHLKIVLGCTKISFRQLQMSKRRHLFCRIFSDFGEYFKVWKPDRSNMSYFMSLITNISFTGFVIGRLSFHEYYWILSHWNQTGVNITFHDATFFESKYNPRQGGVRNTNSTGR